MLFIGITGGVGAGKSTVLDYLAQIPGCRIMLADQLAHEQMEPGTCCYQKLYDMYGKDGKSPADIYLPDGHFDRAKTAAVIFRDAEKLQVFNQIVHPSVKQFVIDEFHREKDKGELTLLVFECALLLEQGFDSICDECWYIYTSEENRRSRLKSSRGYSDAKIDSIFKNQLTEAQFRSKCCETIDNNNSVEETRRQIGKLLLARGIRVGYNHESNG